MSRVWQALRWLFWDRSEPLPERLFFLTCGAVVVAGAVTGSRWAYAGTGIIIAILATRIYISWPGRSRGRMLRMPDPTELDRLDPASRPRPRRRRPGPAEIAVRRDLRKLPPDLRAGALAAAALGLALQMDTVPMTPRDFQGHARELRMCVAQLREWNPAAGEAGDGTDAARQQVEETGRLYLVEGTGGPA